jgi:hypothetical protein
MAVARAAGRPATAGPGRGRGGALLPAAVFLAAAAISGFTILRGLDPFDEGLMLQAARRMADGQLPYRDFLWSYGPGQPLLLGWSFEAFGTSLLGWRILRVATDAAVAVLVFGLVRRRSRPAVAGVAALTAACAMAQPTSANPSALGLALALASLWAATQPPEGRVGRLARGRGPALLAGLLTALAAFWRLDFGLYAAAAVVAALAFADRDRRRALTTYVAAAGAVGLALYAPFAVAAGVDELVDSLAFRSLRDSDYWSLPLPLTYDGTFRLWPVGDLATDAKDVLGFYLPLLALLGFGLSVALAGARWLGGRRPAPQLIGALALGAGCCLYLASRIDEFHVTPLVVVLAVVIPGLLAETGSWQEGAARPAMRAAGLASAALLGLLLLHGAANRLSALFDPPALEPVRVAPADGVKAPPDEARALPRVARAVQSRVPPGDPIYVTALRSDLVRINNPLVYVLTERDNATDADFGLLTSESAQRETVDRLRERRPGAVVRWTDPISVEREPNLRGRAAGSRLLDAYLAAEYRLLERAGDYEVLVPSGR